MPEASASIQIPADLVEYGLKHGDGEIVGERTAPKEVPPVVHGEVEFVVIHHGMMNNRTQSGYIEARDRATGKKLWGVEVYTTVRLGDEEWDTQWVFITAMTLITLKQKDEYLVVQDEERRVYLVDITTRQVMRLPLAQAKQ